MTTIDIPQARPDDVWLTDPGPLWRGAMLDGKRSAIVSCDKGHSAYLAHEIAADGKLTPSLVCPEKGCGWHVYARLVGWSP